MDIIDVLHELNCNPKRKGSTHGGEYCSTCPYCEEGNDRFNVWPNLANKNGYRYYVENTAKIRRMGDQTFRSDNANYVAKKGNLMENEFMVIRWKTLTVSLLFSLILWYYIITLIRWLAS